MCSELDSHSYIKSCVLWEWENRVGETGVFEATRSKNGGEQRSVSEICKVFDNPCWVFFSCENVSVRLPYYYLFQNELLTTKLSDDCVHGYWFENFEKKKWDFVSHKVPQSVKKNTEIFVLFKSDEKTIYFLVFEVLEFKQLFYEYGDNNI